MPSLVGCSTCGNVDDPSRCDWDGFYRCPDCYGKNEPNYTRKEGPMTDLFETAKSITGTYAEGMRQGALIQKDKDRKVLEADEAYANARLIASAPDLLRLLIDARHIWGREGSRLAEEIDTLIAGIEKAGFYEKS